MSHRNVKLVMPHPQNQVYGPTPPRSKDRAYPRRRSDINFHKLDDEGLIHDTVSGNTHWLNSTALFIWQKCDGSLSAPDIARMMTKVYDVSMRSALGHVERLIDELKARNLVQPSCEASPSADST